jgi:hypothetical protein
MSYDKDHINDHINYHINEHINDHIYDDVQDLVILIPNKQVCTEDNFIKRIKYKDIILSDSESEFETIPDSDSDSESNTYIDYKLILQKKNNKNKIVKKQIYFPKIKNKKPIIKIKKDLYKFKNFVKKNISNANNQIDNIITGLGIKSNIELLDRHDMFNKYFIKSIKFLEKNYLNYIQKQINKVDNYHNDIYLDRIYKIKFSYTIFEYENIINIYKNMKKELILDYEKILRHNNLILDQKPDDNLKYLINWFVIKVDYKYEMKNKYFDNQINYYSFLHFANKNIYNCALIIGLIAIFINFITITKLNYNYNYKMVFDLDFVY